MKKTVQICLLMPFVLASVFLGGCGAVKLDPTAQYDLGSLPALDRPVQLSGALSALSIAEISAPAWLDNQQMFYRLAYVNDQQPRYFTTSRWTMPPAQLFVQRLKTRLAQAGGIVVPASDGATALPILRLEADDFSQVFTIQTDSVVRISMRASLFNNRHLLAQKTFNQQVPSPSTDAIGGAKALAKASDAMIGEMMSWLAGLAVK